MLVRLTFFVGIFLIIHQLSAQNVSRFSIPKASVYEPAKDTSTWYVRIQNQEAPKPDGAGFQSELLRRKQVLTQQLLQYKKPNVQTASLDTAAVDTLLRTGRVFNVIAATNSTPNDNTLAVSDSNIVFAAVNTVMRLYDANATGTPTTGWFSSLDNFSSKLNLFGGKYDPKLIFDPLTKRFILVYLNGFSPADSRIVVAFSTSQYPRDPWNIYVLPGNPLNDSSWTDYPAIETNGTDLFITVNLLLPNQSWQTAFKQSIIWQIDKFSGFNGDSTLQSLLWSGIPKVSNKAIRNLHPVRHGLSQYSTAQYFLSNRNFDIENDTLFLLKIDGSLYAGNPQLTVQVLKANHTYHVPLNAPMPNGQWLSTNDARVLGASHLGNTIHFASNTTDTLSIKSAIYYGTINLTNTTVTALTITHPELSFGYPNLVSLGTNASDQRILIGMDHSSATTFPGFSAVWTDHSGNFSQIRKLKDGLGSIDMLSDTLERWGDYFGLQRQFNTPCKFWLHGAFGSQTNRNGAAVAELIRTDTCTQLLPLKNFDLKSSISDVKAYPNPVLNEFFFDFTLTSPQKVSITLYDISGSLVKILHSDFYTAGKKQLQFGTTQLSNGLYFLKISGKDFEKTIKLLK